MNCPSCKSENTQTVKMMCLSGTKSGGSLGLGVTSDLDLGVGVLTSNSQTALAEKFTPGPKPAAMAGCLIPMGIALAIIGAPLCYIMFESTLAAIGCLVVACFEFWIVFSLRGTPDQEILEWEKKTRLLESGWICHKCGNTWIP